MRILLMPASYPPVLGGLQTMAHSLARCLVQAGHEVLVITNRYPRSLPAYEVVEGVSIHRLLFLTPHVSYLRTRRPDLLLAAIFYYPASLSKLSRLVREFRPDVVNVHFPDWHIPFVNRIRHRYSFKLVVSLHGYEIDRWDSSKGSGAQEKPELLRLLRFLQHADAITACSAYLLEKARHLGAVKPYNSYTIHNGIEPERFQGEAYKHSRRYLLAYGRLTWEKGFDLLLHAFAQLAELHPDIDLFIAGAGEEQAALEKLRNELDIMDRVLFYGRATPQEVASLLNGCEFAVVSSRREAFGIAALEAMAAGRPVLATRVGGLPEVLAGTGNKLVEATVAGLKDGIQDWLDGPGKMGELHMLGLHNRAYASSQNWERITEQYLQVYRSPVERSKVNGEW